MSNEHYPYLCGGILLNLLIKAKKTPDSSREKPNGKKSSITDSSKSFFFRIYSLNLLQGKKL